MFYSSQNYHKVVIKRLYYATNWTSTAKIPHDLIETLYHTTVCISSNTVFPLTKCVLLQSSIMVFFSFLRMNHFFVKKKMRLLPLYVRKTRSPDIFNFNLKT